MVRRLGEGQPHSGGANNANPIPRWPRRRLLDLWDDPAADYKLTSEQTTSGIVATLRLCDDCLDIRRNKYGENFVPFTN